MDSCINFYKGKNREIVREAVRKCTEGIPFDLELEMTTVQGREIWVRSRGQPRLREDGQVISVFGTIQEITQRKAAEESLHEAHQALAKANAELRQSAEQAGTLLERATTADHAKGEFLAVMSHEIRTPLNAMLGMSTLLAGSNDLNPEQRDYVETILTSGEALLTLISDILDYSKLDAGVVQLEEQPCDVVDLAASCVGLIAERAEGKGLELELIVARDTPRLVFADIGRLRQILLNLLSNSIKFTSVGHICLRVGVSGITGSRKVFFTVEDSGIGIDPERMGRLFNPFSQADLSITRKFGGTGLGLVISKRIAVAMGGDISVESRLGEGSKFTAYIVPRELPGAPAQGKGAVMIVSERMRAARSLASLYEFLGADVQLIKTVEAAKLELAAAGKPKLLVVDHQLGEAARELLPRTINVPVYLMVPINRSGLKCVVEGFTGRTLFPPRMSALAKSLEVGELMPEEPFTLASSRPSRVEFDGTLGARNPLRILVAEDNHANQQVIRVLLKRMGYEMKLARNGLEAVDAVRREEFDLIFMDVHMPEMDGMTATQSIRDREARGKRTRCRIIALTADARPETIKECVAMGMDGYLTKPLNATAIQNVLASTKV